MPSLKDLKNRIGSVKSTQKISKAKQMGAAAMLRRAEESATAARPYADRMEAVLGSLVASGKMGAHKRHLGRPVEIPHGEFEGKRWSNAT